MAVVHDARPPLDGRSCAGVGVVDIRHVRALCDRARAPEKSPISISLISQPFVLLSCFEFALEVFRIQSNLQILAAMGVALI